MRPQPLHVLSMSHHPAIPKESRDRWDPEHFKEPRDFEQKKAAPNEVEAASTHSLLISIQNSVEASTTLCASTTSSSSSRVVTFVSLKARVPVPAGIK